MGHFCSHKRPLPIVSRYLVTESTVLGYKIIDHLTGFAPFLFLFFKLKKKKILFQILNKEDQDNNKSKTTEGFLSLL